MNAIPKIARKLGLLRDQRGIMRRYARERHGWDTHLVNTKNFIAKHLPVKKGGVVVVLGSGYWLDLPIDTLINHFDKVILVDVYHPRRIQRKAKNYAGVELICADITGGYLELLYRSVRERKVPDISGFVFSEATYLKEANFVISLNILNQLDILICDILQDQFGFKEKTLIPLRKKIQEQHLQLLPQNKSLLIADIEEHIIRKKEKTQVRASLYTALPDVLTEEWTWIFDTLGYYYANSSVSLKVKALKL